MLFIMFIAFGISFGQESRPSGNTGTGPFVKNGKLYDKNGCLFVPRGVNLPAAWHDYNTNGTMYSELDNLAAWGLNSVRIVWSAGISGSGTEDWSHNQAIIYNIIEKCIQEGMIPMLELHDGTGSNRTDWLAQMAQWFANNKNWLDDFDDNLIINIANEWGNYSLAATTWRDAYQNAITTIRNSGLKNCIVIDGKNYAKDISVIQSYGNTLVNHDPEHNIAFGVHYYCGTGESSTTIRNNLEWADNNGICLMVGEFAAQHDNFYGGMCNVQEETIVNECNQNGQGYYWWAWETGNDGVFDLTTVWNSTSYNQLTALGKWLIVDSPDGIQQTSVKASNLGGPACSGGGVTDAITSVSGPTTVSAGENITVQVGYEASTNRDLYVSIQLNESPWSTYGTEKVDVSNGNGTANISLAIDNAAPAGTNYKYQTYITTDGGGWTERLADDLQAGITISDGSGHEHPVPGKIEAEAYTSMSGIQTQTTTDVGGGENVGWVNAGDWLDYNVNVASAGQYDVTFRLASLSNGAKFDLKEGSTVLTSVNIPATGGWQTWTSVTKTVTLSAGSNTLRILATGDGWNINWMEFAEQVPTYTLTVNSGSGDGSYPEDESINLNASTPPCQGSVFQNWTASDGDVSFIDDPNASSTSMNMPAKNVTLTANYSECEYNLTVNSGSGSGLYLAGEEVPISANAPGHDQQFDGWTGDISYVTNPSNPSTTVNMPAQNLSVTASYNGGEQTCDDYSDPSPANWVLRNDWSNQNGSTLSNQNNALVIDYPQWGKYEFYLIQAGVSTSLEAGEQYTVSLDIKGSSVANITEVSVGFSNGYTWSGPTGYAINMTSAGGNVSSSSYTTKEITLTGDNTTSGNLTLLVSLTGQPNQATSYALKNVSICTAGDGGGGQNIPVTGVTVSPENVSLNIEGTSTLSATVSPSDATNKNVTWSSSNTSIAAVDASGVVTAIAEGTTVVTVTTEDGGYTATSNISITSVPPSNKYEAEDATLTGCSTASSASGFTGTGYVNGTTFTNPDKISWTVNGITAGSYDIIIGYNGSMGAKEQELIINGSSKGNFQFNNISNWTTINAGSYSLYTNNTIELKASWGWMHVDYIELVSLKSGFILSNEVADSDGNSILVYPNPVKQSENVYLKHTYDDVVIQISDVQGKLIQIQKYQKEQEITISTGDLKEGLYILQVNESVRKLMIK